MFKKMEYPDFCDMHCHILPKLDDGSKNMEQTINMLKIAQSENIKYMICTPHYHLGRVVAPYADCEERIEQVREVIKENNLDIQLHLGAEICYFDEAVEEIENSNIHTMVGTNYVLVEFNPSVEYVRISEAVNELCMAGYIPIIAHIERYDCMVMELDRCEKLIEAGALIQVNASSVLGNYGSDIKKFIKKMMSEKMVSFVSTDAHSDRSRAPRMKECYKYVAKKHGQDYAKRIFLTNALDIIEKSVNEK